MAYMILAAIFTASDIFSTLIFGKFLDIHLGNFINVEVPAGTLIYPITFLISDVITEVYSKEHAKRVVIASFFATLFVVILIKIIDYIPSASVSTLTNEEFHKVYSLSSSAFCASAMAYLCSQFLDIKIYHTLKMLTPNKYLWARNFLSSSTSQLMDTTVFFSVLYILGSLPLNVINIIFWPTFFLKAFWSIIDTPVFYLVIYLLKPKK